MSKESSAKRGGIGFAGMLTILFIALKLTGHVDWSWWWVLAPLWIGWAVVLAILALLGLAAVLLS
ncbi:hypothetical protein [Dyella sp.]|uniref:hypothetical protein n=1 Tax=Dyella sp. TaxID=1869338 RepID=UPI00284CE7CB|nr:hypothetical protein [Dyella sp.]MDR3445970.1 hypothetical protein [Dyella sp.]